MVCGIYKIQNVKTGRVYIGKSKNIIKRWNEHINNLINHIHCNYMLQIDYDHYNSDSFDFKIICECDNRDLDFYEHLFIEVYGSFYELYNVKGNYNLSDSERDVMPQLVQIECNKLINTFKNNKDVSIDTNHYLYKENKRLKVILNKSKVGEYKKEIDKLKHLVEIYKEENREQYVELEEYHSMDDVDLMIKDFNSKLELKDLKINDLMNENNELQSKVEKFKDPSFKKLINKNKRLQSKLNKSKKDYKELNYKFRSLHLKEKSLDRMIELVEAENDEGIVNYECYFKNLAMK